MTVAIMRTKAEQALIAEFEAIEAKLAGAGWMKALRRGAIGAFAAAGLPHRRIEEWKYTDLRERLREVPPAARPQATAASKALLEKSLGAMAGLDAHRIVFCNGAYQPALSSASPQPGVGFDPLAKGLGAVGFEWLRDNLTASGTAAGNPVLALNTAFASDGALLRIEAGCTVAKPIHLVFLAHGAAPSSVALRNLVEVGRGARAMIIESHLSLDAAHHANVVTEIAVREQAHVQHIAHVAATAGAHLGHWLAAIGEGANYRGFQLTAGAALARNETHVGFTGPDAKLDLSGAMLGRGRDHIDTTLVVRHSTTGCESRELFKAVLDGHARAVFQGKVVVDAIAQKTDGRQMARALMLSEDAEFDSKPELEIYADDVACGHGSTAAEIDPAMLFYLRSRGLPKLDARAMLIESFVAEAVEKVEDEAVRGALMEIALGWLRAA